MQKNKLDPKIMPILKGSEMAQYRFFFIDPDGHITARLDVECLDDEHALEQAAALLERPAGFEVWEGGRMVGTVRPHDKVVEP
jgi:hypothetical protein